MSWSIPRGASGAPSSARVASIALVLAVTMTAQMLVAAAWADAASPTARAARTLHVRDEGHLRFISSSGSQLIDEGAATGTIPGNVRVRFTYNGNPEVFAQFTIHGRNGSISGHAHGRLSNPTSTSPSFRGSLTITGGSSRYAHAGGSGELFGVFNRRSYGLIVQAIATLRY